MAKFISATYRNKRALEGFSRDALYLPVFRPLFLFDRGTVLVGKEILIIMFGCTPP